MEYHTEFIVNVSTFQEELKNQYNLDVDICKLFNFHLDDPRSPYKMLWFDEQTIASLYEEDESYSVRRIIYNFLEDTFYDKDFILIDITK